MILTFNLSRIRTEYIEWNCSSDSELLFDYICCVIIPHQTWDIEKLLKFLNQIEFEQDDNAYVDFEDNEDDEEFDVPEQPYQPEIRSVILLYLST